MNPGQRRIDELVHVHMVLSEDGEALREECRRNRSFMAESIRDLLQIVEKAHEVSMKVNEKIRHALR
jgi:hypothetical protein